MHQSAAQGARLRQGVFALTQARSHFTLLKRAPVGAWDEAA